MKTQEVEPYRVVLMPFPIHLLHAFKYFLCMLQGRVTEKTVISYFTEFPVAHLRITRDPSIFCIAGITLSEIQDDLVSLSYANEGKKLTDQETVTLLELLIFCFYFVYMPAARKRVDIHLILEIASRHDISPQKIVGTITQSFKRCLLAHMNPLRKELHVTAPTVRRVKPKKQKQFHVADRKIRLNPDWKRVVPQWAKYEGSTIIISEGHVRELMDKHLVIVVGGSRGMHKSTVAANLLTSLRAICKRLARRSGWGDFSLKIASVDMDLATPTLNSILSGSGRMRELVRSRKRPWTRELAFEALSKLAHKRDQANIVIADLPGGDPDVITHIVAALGDAAIIIENNLSRFRRWETFFRASGITISAVLRGGKEKGLPFDEVYENPRRTSHVFGLGRSGPICEGFERRLQTTDPYIRSLAEVLIFVILPEIHFRREIARRMYRL